jgi:hypothetical protein
MQPTSGVHVKCIKQPAKLEQLVSRLYDDEKVQNYVRNVDISKSPANFNIDNQTELLNYMKQNSTVSTEHHCKREAYMSKKSFAHAHGTVLGHGTTVFSGPFSYTIIHVQTLDTAEAIINKERLDELNLFEVHSGKFQVQVTSGRLVLAIFAWGAAG